MSMAWCATVLCSSNMYSFDQPNDNLKQVRRIRKTAQHPSNTVSRINSKDSNSLAMTCHPVP